MNLGVIKDQKLKKLSCKRIKKEEMNTKTVNKKLDGITESVYTAPHKPEYLY